MKINSREQSKSKAKAIPEAVKLPDGLPDFESSETETEPETVLSQQQYTDSISWKIGKVKNASKPSS